VTYGTGIDVHSYCIPPNYVTWILQDTSEQAFLLTYAGIPAEPSTSARYGSPGLSLADGFEHPASTLPTRFPAALDIGHGSACGLANACALVYVAA